MAKLIIHETDCHGSGRIYYKGYTDYYSYDDESGNIAAAVRTLINIGFINPDDVVIYNGDEIYDELAKHIGAK
jgi:GH15 family glucan-1,4-alpha-glucosidase